MNLLDFLFWRQRPISYRRAITRARSRDVEADGQQDAFRRAAAAIAGEAAVPFGDLPDGTPVSVNIDAALSSALVIGATGSGKTRFLLGQMLSHVRRLLRIGHDADSPLDIDLELVDPKHETYDLLAQYIAALWLAADETTRERIASAVRVIDWSPDAVTPFAPFDNPTAEVSNAYVAYLRTDVSVQAGPQAYTEPQRQAAFMLNRLLVARRFPPNYRFAVRFFEDEMYRRSILTDLSDADVRAFFGDAGQSLPRQTREALLRRIQADMSFPEVRLSIGIPPADIERLLPRRTTPIVMGNYGFSMALPMMKAKERASYRLIDVLLDAARRDPRRRALLVIEESPMLLSSQNELTQTLMEASRTLRSRGVGLLFAGQDFANALPSQMVRTLMLNTRWWAIFQSREEAEWLYPHAVMSAADRQRPEGERHRVFVRTIQSLERRNYYLLVKGQPALPVRAPEVLHPSEFAHETAEMLREVFRREIASRSMLPAATAADLIAKWEAEVVDGSGSSPARPRAVASKPSSKLVDFIRRLEGDDE